MDFLTWTFSWLWLVFEIFLWAATLMILIMVIIDLFKDHSLAGGWKALWLIFLLFLPLLGTLVYIIARGKGMNDRWAAKRATVPEEDSYKPAASSSPADDIAQAKALLDAGSISQGEFDALKSKALGNQYFG
ncbi:PLDc N-terminal domain-containing protein [Streptomyces scabiei]|uniref:PLDc N-terminal domain-containing protein n=1 Tax=Streptomyces scabiei TaxID=1930 RepID=UPI0029902571|nr:PLDc N-terminal domain-containing protein [Streptomyces scabiei]MDW8807933.1 PLDc N-terminal domain-containing protein [Streptomyces scabiei]